MSSSADMQTPPTRNTTSDTVTTTVTSHEQVTCRHLYTCWRSRTSSAHGTSLSSGKRFPWLAPNGALANTNWTINKVLITNIQCFLLFVFVGAPTNIVAVQATTAARRKSCHAGLVLQMAILLDW
ncbi:hypothetical protein PF004_g13819 [Phytophthora fragariae]|uniref:Uncharacterized protein n=2 Tax=Phytophthora fragariae TaxID=53985 RepID=A0A6G0NR13_9STRA|nr:hypothetical protein PF004_g13819 [Phytophthora fragariae]